MISIHYKIRTVAEGAERLIFLVAGGVGYRRRSCDGLEMTCATYDGRGVGVL